MTVVKSGTDFQNLLLRWHIQPTKTLVPTESRVRNFKTNKKIKIIADEHEATFYKYLDELHITDTRYKALLDKGLTPKDILIELHGEYKEYLRNITKQLKALQRLWTNFYPHERSRYVIKHLEDDGYAKFNSLCDLVHSKRVPFELVLKLMFQVSSMYGDYRPKRTIEQLAIEPYVKVIYEVLCEVAKDKKVPPHKLFFTHHVMQS